MNQAILPHTVPKNQQLYDASSQEKVCEKQIFWRIMHKIYEKECLKSFILRKKTVKILC